MIQSETLCLFLDDRELWDDFLHIAVSGLLVFAECRVMKVHLLQSQKVLATLLLHLLSITFIRTSDTWCEPAEVWAQTEETSTHTNNSVSYEAFDHTLKTLPNAPLPRWSSTEKPLTTLRGGRFWSTASMLSLRQSSSSSCITKQKVKNPPCQSTWFYFIYYHFFLLHSPKPAE